MTWLLEEHGFKPSENLHWEGLFTCGSGRLHLRGSLEESLAESPQDRDFVRVPGNVTVASFDETQAKWGSYLPGLYGAHPLMGHEIINLPWAGQLELQIAGERFDPSRSRFENWRRRLHLERAELTRQCTWQSATGAVHLHWRRFVSAARPQILVQEIRIRAEQNCEIQIDAGIDARVRTSGYDHFSQVDCQPHDQSIRMQIVTDRDELVQIASRLMLPDITIQQSERLISQRATLSVNKPGAARNPRVRSYRSAPGFCS